MKKKLMAAILLIASLKLGCTIVFPEITSTPEEYQRVEKNFKKLKTNMTKAEVEKLIGKPREAKVFNNEEIWLLHVNESTQGIKWPFVTFNSKTNKVTKIFLEEPDNIFMF